MSPSLIGLLAGLLSLNSGAMDDPKTWQLALSKAAIERTHHKVIYNGAYRRIEYPNGDVPANIGVCTDVVIRAYRQLGFDLQQAVHEDMLEAFEAYPEIWGLTKPDPNIDHRRVPNLQTYFSRHGGSLEISKQASDYQAGDVVSWMLDNGRPHIGIVTRQYSKDGQRPLIVHNIGLGPKIEDMLFDYQISGHYRFDPKPSDSK